MERLWGVCLNECSVSFAAGCWRYRTLLRSRFSVPVRNDFAYDFVMSSDRVIELYEHHAEVWVQTRNQEPFYEQVWLDHFAPSFLGPGPYLIVGAVLESRSPST